jgi:hypothetical protein
MLFLEFSDGLLKLYLSGSQRVNLHEFLEIEEGLRDWEFVAAAWGSKEILKLCPVRQFQDDVIDLPQGLWIHILQVFSLKNGIKEEFANLAHVRVLKRDLRIYHLYLMRKLVLERSDNAASSYTN